MKRDLSTLLKGTGRITLAYLLFLVVVAAVSGGIAVALDGSKSYPSWREARSDSNYSTGLAPDPEHYGEAVIQVYAARTWGLKKAFSVHTWIAVKRPGADRYQVHEVVGWRRYRGLPVLSRSARIPDGPWYGNRPQLLLDLRGDRAEALIDRIERAAASYPWPHDYRAWPGPNSNTFTAWIGRQVPELGLDLPSTAIGKDFVPLRDVFGPSVGGGVQASLVGILSVAAGPEEGLELNLLGLSLEIDLLDLAVELPGFGRIGPAPVSGS